MNQQDELMNIESKREFNNEMFCDCDNDINEVRKNVNYKGPSKSEFKK